MKKRNEVSENDIIPDVEEIPESRVMSDILADTKKKRNTSSNKDDKSIKMYKSRRGSAISLRKNPG